jgi:two-component system OmpR family response regulator
VRCLIIEDEKPLAIATAEALKEHGWVVDLAHDGRTGLSMGMQSDYDVICIDIMLPALNGYDVLKHLRAGEVWTPVLMLTAKDGEYDQTDAFRTRCGRLRDQALPHLGPRGPALCAHPSRRQGASGRARRR